MPRLATRALARFVPAADRAASALARARLYRRLGPAIDTMNIHVDAMLGDPSDHVLGVGCFVGPGAVLYRRGAGTITVGADTYIDRGVLLNAGDGDMVIGALTFVGSYSYLNAGDAGLRIGAHCQIAPHVSIVAENHDTTTAPLEDERLTSKGIVIGDRAWIGTGARILDGVTIGDRAVVGAGAVVTRSVAAGTVVGGVPAKVLETGDQQR